MTSARPVFLATTCIGLCGACAADHRQLVVTLGASHDAPVAGHPITVLPFDPDRILDSLALAAPTPRPTFPALEHALMQFHRRERDTTAADGTRPWRALRDTVVHLSDTLTRLDRRHPEYATLYERFRESYARLAQLTADSRSDVLNEREHQLARRAQAAAESLRAWEREAFADFDRLVAGELTRLDRDGRDATTDSTGVARFELEPGTWWIVTRYPDPENPFLEYYWNAPVRVTSWFPLNMPLLVSAADRRWRH